jgi:hypothetical protein
MHAEKLKKNFLFISKIQSTVIAYVQSNNMTAAQMTPLNDRSTPSPTSTKILLKKIETVWMVSESGGGLWR